MQKPVTLWTACAMTLMSGCDGLTIAAGATEQALCTVWGESLPTRSRLDTGQTQTEIQQAYADFANACPEYEGLIPQ